MKSAFVIFWVVVVSGSLTWKEVLPSDSSLVPSGRYKFAFGYDKTSNQIILCCGRDANDRILRDTWILSLATFTWKKIASDVGDPKPPRKSIVTYGMEDNRKLIVAFTYKLVGDRGEDRGMQVWSFDPQEGGRWQEVLPTSDLHARYGSVGGISSKNRLIVSHGTFHGNTQKSKSYAFELTPPSQISEDITPKEGVLPPKRAFAAGTIIGDKLVMSGGLDSNFVYMDDTWMLDIEDPSAQWSQVNSRLTPGNRGLASMVQFSDHEVIQFGGASDENMSVSIKEQQPGEYAVLDLKTLQWTLEKPRANTKNPQIRSGQGLVRVNNESSEFFVLFGGKTTRNHTTVALNDLWVLCGPDVAKPNDKIDPPIDDSASSRTQGAFMGVMIAVMASVAVLLWM